MSDTIITDGTARFAVRQKVSKDNLGGWYSMGITVLNK